MTLRPTSALGLCLLFVLAFAVAAAEASATSTTAYTCKKEAGGGPSSFKTEHCDWRDGTGEYRHVAIANNTKTEATGGNQKTSLGTTGATGMFFHTVITGIVVELEAESVTGSGFLENKEEEAQMKTHGTGTITFNGVRVWFPSLTGCKVEGEKVVSKELTAITVAEGVKFQPKEGTLLAEFNMIGATCPEATKGNYKVTGSVIGTPEGATISFTGSGTTAQKTLKARNVAAGLDGKGTVSARANSSEGYTPVGLT